MNIGFLVKIIGGVASIPAAVVGSSMGVSYGLTSSKDNVVKTEEISKKLKDKLGDNLSNTISNLVKDSIQGWNDNLGGLKANIKQAEEAIINLLSSNKESLNTLLKTLNQEVSSSVTSSEIELKEKIESANSEVKNSEEQFNQQLSNKSSSLESQIENLKETLQAIMKKETETSLKTHKDVLERFQDKVSNLDVLYKYIRHSSRGCTVVIKESENKNKYYSFQDFLKNVKDKDAINYVQSQCFNLKSTGTITIDKKFINFYNN